MLDIAAAHGDHRRRMLPAATANHRPVLFVCHRRDGAGVDDIAVTGLIEAADLMTLVPEQLLHGLGLILVGLAAKGIKCKLHVKSTKNSKYTL